MSANAASLSCPICLHSVFENVEKLRDRLIFVSNNKILCPVCQEEVLGLDKLTIHLFSHVKLITHKNNNTDKIKEREMCEMIVENKSNITLPQQIKKLRPCRAKNKPNAANSPVKFVKIYPKLPVISLNPVPLIDISATNPEETLDNNNLLSNSFNISSKLGDNTICNICGLQFIDLNILNMHKCLIHNIQETSIENMTKYQCHLCSKNFKMRGSLMVHLRVAHFGFPPNTMPFANQHNSPSNSRSEKKENDKFEVPDRNDNKQWQCDVCKKCFTTKYFLKKHKRLHTGETPYACAKCNKTFTFQQSYHKHLLYHNDEKPHICAHCGRAFKELSTLHNHQRIHTGEKPFSCETCGKCFRQRVSYLVHKRIHTGVMPYKCTACDKSFRYKVSQRTHKCQAQPPGMVIRQSGDLVEKLKKKYNNLENGSESTKKINSLQYLDISEVSAELVKSGSKLSLEDTEAENFALFPFSIDVSAMHNNINEISANVSKNNFHSESKEDKSIPSPSEILKKLCLSTEHDTKFPEDTGYQEIFRDLNDIL